MLQYQLSALKRRFSNRPNYIQTAAGLNRLTFTSFEGYWIVGRSRCMYRCVDFPHVPKGKRASAVAHQVRIWSPFDSTGHHVVWDGSTAMVWFWDQDLVAQARSGLDAHSNDAARLTVLPETVFHPRREDGAFLVACHEGYEAQHWGAGILRDAAWFREEPEEAQIARFLKRQKLTSTRVEVISADQMTAEPWGTRHSPGEWLALNERRLVAACLVLLAAGGIWQEARYWKIVAQTNSVSQQFQRLQDEVGPLLSARNDAQQLRLRNARLAQVVDQPSQALLMSLVDEALPNAGASFQEWHYQQGELRLILEDPKMNPIEYVRSLEKQPRFANVRAEQARGRDRIEITMDIVAPT